jgi:hypothetical protein
MTEKISSERRTPSSPSPDVRQLMGPFFFGHFPALANQIGSSEGPIIFPGLSFNGKNPIGGWRHANEQFSQKTPLIDVRKEKPAAD